uniref:Uncharacterized protein n=1 Tax=Chromera velia CCMP2878 TaxID=1169474 RepID=A0A0G4G568_9ALVE|eukprot:Cvel_20232.t1-p1 / transcript=Cvel_20232.t1 / gene=Cvel_20232 / organism=Chromera_velia_CCMP2878 / gene_product=Ankyrin repeat domain-containing protein 55, putative / transcript_product=Ankyrin repeat domain-containing protein 55, putative / location=Cvel_scaffold1802:26271-35616(+) / protein_length=1317 / sequence_SO=supercontig / SO=protein_coding / is_pseudo=false
MQTLLTNGANPTLVDRRDRTCLFLAAQEGKLKAIQFLLKEHPELLNVPDDTGRTPLQKGHREVVEALVEAKADLLAVTKDAWDKKTALHYAAKKGDRELMKYLINAGADENAKDVNEGVPNDQTENAQVLEFRETLESGASIASVGDSFSVSVNGTTVGASAHPDYSRCGGSSSRPGVWYSFRVPESNSTWRITVDTCKSSLSTRIGLLSGECSSGNDGGCSCIGTNGWGSCGGGSRISTAARGGEDFRVLVRSSGRDPGPFELTLTATVLPPPPENNAIEKAANVTMERAQNPASGSTLSHSYVTVDGSLLSASTDTSVCSDDSDRAGVWYSVEVNETSALSVEVTSNERSMRAFVLKGSECLSDPSSAPCSCLTRRGQKEQTSRASPSTYFVWVYADADAALREEKASFTLTAAVLPPPPENNAVSGAVDIDLESVTVPASGLALARSSASVEGSLLSASNDASVCSDRSGRAGVWYRVEVNETSALTVALQEDGKAVHVLKGSECLSDPSSALCSCVTSRGQREQAVLASPSTYFVWVYANSNAALSERTSAFTLTVTSKVLPSAPENDAVAGALNVIMKSAPIPASGLTLARSSATVEGSLLSASNDASVCSDEAGRAGVWYRVEVNETSALSVVVAADEWSLRALVLKGNDCLSDPSSSPCTCLTSRGQKESAVQASPGTYLVWVYANSEVALDEQTASFTLTLTTTVLPPVPDNDAIAGAMALGMENVPGPATGSALARSSATVEGSLLSASNDASVCFDRSGYVGVWYRLEVNETSALSVAVTSNQLFVLEGSECLADPFNATNCRCMSRRGQREQILRTAPESTYFVWVFADSDASFMEHKGAFNLTVSSAILPAPPANAQIDQATPLSLGAGDSFGSDSVVGSFLTSAPSSGGSVCGEGGGVSGNGVWHRMQVAERGIVTLRLKKTLSPEKSEFSLQATFIKSGAVSPTSTELTLDAPVSGEINGSAPHSFSFLPRESGRVAFTLCSSRPTSLTVLNGSATVGSADVTVYTGCREVWVDVNEGERLGVEIPFEGGDRGEEGGEFFTLSAKELPVPPASRWESAFELQGNQTVEFSTSVVPPGLYWEGLSVFWFSHRAERQKGLSLTLCRRRERDELVQGGASWSLSEATCSAAGCNFSNERLALQNEREYTFSSPKHGQACTLFFRTLEAGESVLLFAFQREFPVQSEHAGSLSLNVTEFELPPNGSPQSASPLALGGEVLVDTSFAYSIPFEHKGFFPGNLTDSSGLWYRLDVPQGSSRVAVAVGLCALAARDEVATVDLRVCPDGEDISSCRTVVKKDVSKVHAKV